MLEVPQNALSNGQSLMGVGLETLGEEGTGFLTFRLEGEMYGVPILSVQEIIGYQPATPVPNTPDWVSGVINLRGVVIPVLDLRTKFGMAAGRYDATSVIILVQVADKVMGSVVDGVDDVLYLTDEEIQPTPEMSGPVPAELLTGLGGRDGRLVRLLDLTRLLADALQAPG